MFIVGLNSEKEEEKGGCCGVGSLNECNWLHVVTKVTTSENMTSPTTSRGFGSSPSTPTKARTSGQGEESPSVVGGLDNYTTSTFSSPTTPRTASSQGDGSQSTLGNILASVASGNGPEPRREVYVRSDPTLLTCFDPVDKELYDLWAPKRTCIDTSADVDGLEVGGGEMGLGDSIGSIDCGCGVLRRRVGGNGAGERGEAVVAPQMRQDRRCTRDLTLEVWTRREPHREQDGESGFECGCIRRARWAWRAASGGEAGKRTEGIWCLKLIVGWSMAVFVQPSIPVVMPAHHPRRPSVSSTMHWLSRKDSKASPERTLGATVVRTPEDALRDTNVRVTFDAQAQPSSPPLPPLPIPEDGEVELLEDTPRPAKPRRPVPAAPSPTPSSSSSVRPSLKSRSSTAVEDPPHVPPVPSHIPLSAPVPPFTPILVSAPLGPDTDPSKVIITLETCTATHKSTLATLSSRPSFLADYLTELINSPAASQASSVYSTESADVERYRNHLATQGLLPAASSSTSLHIFLDRPSAPYTHILTFLRTPSSLPEYPSTLPRSVQLSSLTHSTSSSLFNAKLEALLELRDETAYLGLDSLYKLCTDEIRQRLHHAPRHTRGTSHASVNTMMGPGLLPSLSGRPPSVQSHHASVYSLHTLIERVEGDLNSSNKDALDRVSRGSESLDEDYHSPLLPLNFPMPPLPIPTPTPTTTVTTTTLPPSTTAPILPPARHLKNLSASSQATTKSKHPTGSSSPSPSYSPPQSASSSPGQMFTRPPQLHKKSESLATMPMRPPPPLPESASRRPESRKVGRTAAHHTPSPSVNAAPVGPAPPGWI
ncbi:hypothetical protein P691DRAFT_782445 [Macrolepiota fuliginosa MF-IS2]|uniref:BTB domain-containing protein n=1 Tax=Macrolepiota fuliginosa MF-IS2 TaxID=1400762 RepID=A0A9P5XNT4_9AGAR|nr:hypothetical protein P691DRAFT_782445 [Macrolepiota fuliginosa MF-IS2]